IECGDDASFGQIELGVFGAGDEMTVGHFDGDEPLQLVVVSEIDDPETSFSQDACHSVTPDMLRCGSGSIIHGSGQERACIVEVVHGQSSSGQMSPLQSEFEPRGGESAILRCQY